MRSLERWIGGALLSACALVAMAALQAMPDSQLRDLAILAQRTPPQEREALRRGLMQTTDLNRAAWLELRLER